MINKRRHSETSSCARLSFCFALDKPLHATELNVYFCSVCFERSFEYLHLIYKLRVYRRWHGQMGIYRHEPLRLQTPNPSFFFDKPYFKGILNALPSD